MRSPRIVILDPQLSKDILVKYFKSFRENEFSKMIDAKDDPLFARNPFLSRADNWKERRNEISPAFSTNRMKALYPLIENVCHRLTSFINECIDEPIEARDLSVKFTTESVSSCIFGIETDTLQKGESDYRKMAKRLTKPSTFTIMKIMLTTMIPALKKLIKVQFVDNDVNEFFINLFRQAFEYRTNNRDDFLDYLLTLKKKKGFSQIDLAGHSMTFFIDGVETSSLLISFMLFEVRKRNAKKDSFKKILIKIVGKK